jgi:hypothetical protein
MIYTRQVYKQQQSAVATEGSKETRFFYGDPFHLACMHLVIHTGFLMFVIVP